MEAHKQGSIDQLCGIYAVLNSTRLVIQPSRTEPHLFRKLFSALIQRRGNNDFIGDGLYIPDIACMLKDVICKEYPVKRSKPWHKSTNVPLDEYWGGITDFLKEPNRAVIILFQNSYMGHWSVVKEATNDKLILFDSNGTRNLKRQDCTTSEISEKRTKLLFPTMTYFIERA